MFLGHIGVGMGVAMGLSWALQVAADSTQKQRLKPPGIPQFAPQSPSPTAAPQVWIPRAEPRQSLGEAADTPREIGMGGGFPGESQAALSDPMALPKEPSHVPLALPPLPAPLGAPTPAPTLQSALPTR